MVQIVGFFQRLSVIRPEFSNSAWKFRGARRNHTYRKSCPFSFLKVFIIDDVCLQSTLILLMSLWEYGDFSKWCVGIVSAYFRIRLENSETVIDGIDPRHFTLTRRIPRVCWKPSRRIRVCFTREVLDSYGCI